MNKISILIFCVLSLLFTPINSHAFKEDFNFIILDIPPGWEVKEKSEKSFTLENSTKTASFSCTIMPVYHVDIESFAQAIMQAYGGYNFKLREHAMYYFDFMSAGRPAWTIVKFHNANAIIQTGIGKSPDFSLLINAGQLK